MQQAGNLAAHSACPFHFTCAATSPFHITYSLFSFLFLPPLLCVWCGGSLRVYSAPVLVGLEVAAEGAARRAEAILREWAAVVEEDRENFTRMVRVIAERQEQENAEKAGSTCVSHRCFLNGTVRLCSVPHWTQCFRPSRAGYCWREALRARAEGIYL